MGNVLNNNSLLGSSIIDPDYAGLSSVEFHARHEGLVTNTTNSYGVVDGSGNVTTLKSITPAPTGRDLTSVGTAPTLSGDGISFGGAGRLRASTSTTWANFMHYNATLANLKWTAHGVVKLGTTANAAYGIFGTNGTSSASKGVSFYFDDRSSQHLNNAISLSITNGTSGQYIIQSGNTNVIPRDVFFHFWLEIDKSDIIEDQVRLWINGQRVVVSNNVVSSSPVTTPTNEMEIGAAGNNIFPATMTLKELTFQSAIESEIFRRTFTSSVMLKYSIAPPSLFIDGIQITSDFNLFNTLSESRYYLTNHLCQKPSDGNTIVSIFSDGTDHFFSASRKVSSRTSTDKGRTWSSKSTVYDPTTGTEAIGDPSAGYGDDGRLHLIVDTHTSFSIGGTHTLKYLYSDDDGATWSSPLDITSVLPSDGNVSWRCYCKIIENDGRLMMVMYKFKDETDGSASARYLIYSDDNGANWSAQLIQSSVTLATYRNESAIIALSSTNLLVVTRDDQTMEWVQSVSTNNGTSWTNQGALTFGESLTRAAPVRLVKFQISGSDVIACYFSDRDKDVFKVNYALPSVLISSGISGWTTNLKFTIHQGSGEHLHYGDICHYDGDFKAIGQYVIDPFPPTGSGTENEMYTFDVPTYHYQAIKTALGL